MKMWNLKMFAMACGVRLAKPRFKPHPLPAGHGMTNGLIDVL